MNISSFLIGYQAGKNAGGGSSADVRYVTFMSYDGTEEHGRIPVAVGYDCPNPKFTVTRESTAQYNFVHDAWATEPNGATDANALKAVTEDRVVYATFISVLRYYTITYYDSDGTTILKTESMAYGSVPSYAPEKEGFAFTGWTPTLATVTENASYQSSWTSVITFSNASWPKIAEIIEEGRAEDCFKVGDTKILTLTLENETINVPVKLADFDHDDLADGSGKAKLSIVSDRAITTIPFTDGGNAYRWYGSGQRAICKTGGTIDLALPNELRSIIKPVSKSSANGMGLGSFTNGTEYITTDTLWLLSEEEVNSPGSCWNSVEEGYAYPIFTDNASRIRKTIDGKECEYLLRSGYPTYAGACGAVTSAGGVTNGSYSSSTPAIEKAIVFGFCI